MSRGGSQRSMVSPLTAPRQPSRRAGSSSVCREETHFLEESGFLGWDCAATAERSRDREGVTGLQESLAVAARTPGMGGLLPADAEEVIDGAQVQRAACHGRRRPAHFLDLV